MKGAASPAWLAFYDAVDAMARKYGLPPANENRRAPSEQRRHRTSSEEHPVLAKLSRSAA